MNKTIAILGASGFIGRRLVSELVCKDEYRVRVLSRDKLRDLEYRRFGQEVTVFQGSPDDPDSLRNFLVPGCVVINLVYLWDQGEQANLACINALLTACMEAKISRLIHCSTADVAGRVSVDSVNEETTCTPISEYGTTKLKIERIIAEFSQNNFDYTILRPTSVFGIEGAPLKRLINDINTGGFWKNYIKSCLFNRRRMNLVPLANVTSAIVFLIQYVDRLDGAIFIISSDEDPQNNYREIELMCRSLLGVKDYFIPPLPVPLIVLKCLLWIIGRSNINPLLIFDSSKLHELGFKNPTTLIDGLAEYVTWHLKNKRNETPSNKH